MTVEIETTKHTYDGNGVTTLWDYEFPILDADHIEVILTDADGVEGDPLSSGYSVDEANQQVLYPTSGSPLASGWKITLARRVPKTQGVNLREQGARSSEVLEEGYDKLTMLVQQLQEELNRTPKFKISSDQAAVEIDDLTAGYLIAVSADGSKIEMRSPSGLVANAAAVTSSASGVVTETTVQGAIDFLAAKVTGTRASPSAIVAGTGIAPVNTTWHETKFIQGSGGAVDVSANPQVAAGSRVGQRLTLICVSDTNTVTLENGTGLILNGSYTMVDGSVLELIWDGTNWQEITRNDL